MTATDLKIKTVGRREEKREESEEEGQDRTR